MTSNGGLRDAWFPLAWAQKVTTRPTWTSLLGEPLVMARLAGSRAVALRDGRASGRAYAAEERDGLVWACLGEPKEPAPRWPYLDRPGFCGFAQVDCNYVRLIENMMDAAHAGFVHGGLLRGAPSAEVHYTVRETPTGVVKASRGERARGSLLYNLFGRGHDQFRHVEEFILPNIVRAEYRTLDDEVVYSTQFACTPIAEKCTRVFYRVCINGASGHLRGLAWLARPILRLLVGEVMSQDRFIIEAEERAREMLGAQEVRHVPVSTSADIAALWAGRRARAFARGVREPRACRTAEVGIRL